MPSTVRINTRTKGFVHHPPKPLRSTEKVSTADYIVLYPDSPLEPHISFSLQSRLQEELALREPAQPFPANPLASELPVPPSPGYAHAGVQASRVTKDSVSRSASPASAINVASGGVFEGGLIEPREYDLDEVTGTESVFNLRLVNWGGGTPHAVTVTEPGEKEPKVVLLVVLLLAGCSRDGDWLKDVVEPATFQCDLAMNSATQAPGDESAPALAGGVGTTFNDEQPPFGHTGPGMVLNTVVFFQLMASMAMKCLLGFGNRFLEVYCTVAFSALQAQKDLFLQHDPCAMYPSDASVFSAASVEFGGPPRGQASTGVPDRYEAGSWSILCALGKYSSVHGGHVIFWDLGLVIAFPSGSTILIPTGLVRYSFVKVREGERRYSVLQWAGSGLTRWALNGGRTDVEFAGHATEAEHAEREARRQESHEHMLDRFPVEADLPDATVMLPCMETRPMNPVEQKPRKGKKLNV
ncbi:hypothetical protein C8R43DRAFT_1140605 [Mycena crocata]|nr:hypothetical protein C8R43DRAFT_1140605 [Mycena crocata]